MTSGDEIDVQVLLPTRPRLVLDDGRGGKYAMDVRGLIGRPGTDHLVVSRPASASCSTIRHLRCARRSRAKGSPPLTSRRLAEPRGPTVVLPLNAEQLAQACHRTGECLLEERLDERANRHGRASERGRLFRDDRDGCRRREVQEVAHELVGVQAHDPVAPALRQGSL
jgi:hypothetical protein